MKRQTMLTFLLICALVCSSTHVTARQAPTKKYVIFRDDDVSPGIEIALLEAVNRVHIEENVPVTLGIIPHQNDAAKGNELLKTTSFIGYMRSIASNSLFEFAQHGNSHVDNGLSSFPSEFCAESYPLQVDAIQKGQSDMNEAFGVRPTTFIPPFNRGDENTLKAAETLGFTVYSTGLADINVLKGRHDATKLQAVSLDMGGKDLPNMKDLTEQFFSGTDGGRTLIIMYHIWSFKGAGDSVDTHNVTVLRDYIQYLKNRGDILFTRSDLSYTTASSDVEVNTSLATERNVVSAAELSNVSAPHALAYRQELQAISLPGVFLPAGLVVMTLLALVMFARRWRQT